MQDAGKNTRRWYWLLLLLATWLLVVLLAVGWRELHPQWRTLQRRAAAGRQDAPWLGMIFSEPDCSGDGNRCRTCHFPGQEHPAAMRSHLDNQSGCSHCHGGTGRALVIPAAHSLPGTRLVDPLMYQPFVQASCAGCHLPGEKPGSERLARGAMLFLRLGCSLCHPLGTGGRGGFDFGPDLSTMGRRSTEELRTAIIDPRRDFAASTMPSFATSFATHPEQLDDLLVFLLSLSLPPLDPGGDGWCRSRAGRWQGLVEQHCSACHNLAGRRAGGTFRHRCSYLLERGAELNCSRCHRQASSADSDDDCPLLEQHRRNCVVCHRQARGERS